MYLDSREWAPYFCEGLLFLPQSTVELLVDYGLDASIAEGALHGLALDDNKAQIGEISNTLEKALAEMAENSPIYQALTSDETQFLLTGHVA